jgi:hypothetical protein
MRQRKMCTKDYAAVDVVVDVVVVVAVGDAEAVGDVEDVADGVAVVGGGDLSGAAMVVMVVMVVTVTRAIPTTPIIHITNNLIAGGLGTGIGGTNYFPTSPYTKHDAKAHVVYSSFSTGSHMGMVYLRFT